uniref:Uncharacterized protein n=1 Tax=Panagrolaimus davidi TaxID=227884 RepID=A0A914P9V1_9BILA
MVRQYAIPDEPKDENGKVLKVEGPKRWIIRKARRKILLRGTMRYCSLNVHKRNEQGRGDDIISLIYMLLEMRFPLPWASATREERLIALKEAFPTDPNLNKCEGMRDILQYLHNLKFSERPDYKFIYNFNGSYKEKKMEIF